MRLSIKIIMYIIAIVFIFTFGATGTYILGHYGNGFNIKIKGPIDAAYFTVITLSTVGYGDIVPVTGTAKLFVMALIIGGLGIFLSAVTVVGGDFVNSRIEKFSGGITNLERRFLRNHIVLVGTDTVNIRLAEKLKEKRVRFIILTADKATLETLRSSGYRAYFADETDENTMKKFELGRAKSIIIDMRDKSRMIYALLVIRNLARDSRVVTVAHNREEERNVRNLSAGIGIINPPSIASDILSKRIMEL